MGASAAFAEDDAAIADTMSDIPQEFLTGEAVLLETGEKMYMTPPELAPGETAGEAAGTFSNEFSAALSSFNIGKVFGLIGDALADLAEASAQQIEDGGFPWELAGLVFFALAALANFGSFIAVITGSFEGDQVQREEEPTPPRRAAQSNQPRLASTPVRRAPVRRPAAEDEDLSLPPKAASKPEPVAEEEPEPAAPSPTPAPPPSLAEKKGYVPPKRSA